MFQCSCAVLAAGSQVGGVAFGAGGDQGQRLALRSPHEDVGAGVMFVFAGQVFVGGEEDLGAVGGHAVEEDAFGGARGEVDRLLRVADVHVEVPVAWRLRFS